MVYSTRRFVLCLTLSYFVLVFFSPFNIASPSLGEERANRSAFRTFVRFAPVWFCLFSLPLGVWDGLRFVIVALPGLFSYLICHVWNNQSTFNSYALLYSVKCKLKERYFSLWKKQISDDEAQAYQTNVWTYLEKLHGINIKKCICSFRISIHRLRIERGRYIGEKPKYRLCGQCNLVEK